MSTPKLKKNKVRKIKAWGLSNERKEIKLYFDPCYENGNLRGGIYTCDKCNFNVCVPPWNKGSAEEEHKKRLTPSPSGLKKGKGTLAK